MKKLFLMTALVLFTLSACQTDTENAEVESIHVDDTKLKSIQDDASIFEILDNIPEKYKDNPKAYLQSQYDMKSAAESDDGCVSFVYPFAYIEPGCFITSGVPREFRDCNTTDVIYLACGFEPSILCFVCEVEYTIRCDGRETKIIGYDITCLGGNPQPL